MATKSEISEDKMPEKRKKEFNNKGGKKYYRYEGDDMWIEVTK